MAGHDPAINFFQLDPMDGRLGAGHDDGNEPSEARVDTCSVRLKAL
jgi:hypothetical protein